LGPEELKVTGGAENCIRRIIHVLGQTSLNLSKLRIFRWERHVTHIGRTDACENIWLEYLKRKLFQEMHCVATGENTIMKLRGL